MKSKIYEGYQTYNYDKSSGSFQHEDNSISSEKKRFFISLMSESLIKKGVFFKLRKRTRVS